MKHFPLIGLLAATVLGGVAMAQDGAPAPRPGTHAPTTRDEATARADAMFARLDTDRDGQVTVAEMQAVQQRRAERREARGKAPGGRGGRMGERMFARLDTDGSGGVSQAEYRAAALQRFERVDTNGDGRIDAAETQAIRDRMESRRGARRGGATPPPAGE